MRTSLLGRWTVWALAIAVSSGLTQFTSAGDWPGAERRVVRLDHTEEGIRAAHDKVEKFGAILVPEDSQLEIHAADATTIEETTDGELKLAVKRFGVFAMGSELAAADAKQLPFFSGGIIRNHIRDHFLSIQARVTVSPQGVPYVLDRALIGVCKYADREFVSKSTELVDRSSRDIRSHGFLTEKTADGQSLPPRTLVVSIRNTRAVTQGDGSDQLVPHYEYLFIHGRRTEKETGLTLHGFGTTHFRTRLHCFTRTAVPSQLSDCAIQGTIVFTSFGYGGQVPQANATRKVRLNEQTACNVTRLNEWLKERELPGDAWDHLPLIFDAMLDGTAPSDEPPKSAVAPDSVTSLSK